MSMTTRDIVAKHRDELASMIDAALETSQRVDRYFGGSRFFGSVTPMTSDRVRFEWIGPDEAHGAVTLRLESARTAAAA